MNQYATVRKMLTTTISIILLFLVPTSCWLDREGTKPDCQGETASIKFRLDVGGPGTSLANRAYQATVRWQATLLVPDSQNTCGNTQAFDITKTYSGTRDSSGDFRIEQVATEEHPGLWRFSATHEGQTFSCEKNLGAGETVLVWFPQPPGGC